MTGVAHSPVPRPPRGRVASFLSFPDPVNEVSARLVAAGVVVMGVLALILDEHATWLLVLLAYGFIARVLTGPTMSPLGQLVTRVITPRTGLADKQVAGPPKRFAQAMGAGFALCLGCKVFAVLMRVGVVPEEVCERCNNIWLTAS